MPTVSKLPKKRHSHYAVARGRSAQYPVPIDRGDHIFNGEPILRLIPQREFVPTVPFKLYESRNLDASIKVRQDQLGPVLSQQVPVVTGSDMSSLLAAFDKRCNFHSDDSVAPIIVKSAKRLADLVFPKVQPFAWSQELYDDWVSRFDSDKQARMARALLNLHDVDFRSLNTKSLMVKGEVLLKRNDPSWAPRVIYVGTDEYNLLTGPIQHCFNKRLKRALDEFRHPIAEVMFAYSEVDTSIASFMSGQSRYFEGDFKSNDKSQLGDVHLIFGHWLKRAGVPSWFLRFYAANSKTFRVVSYEYGVSADISNQLATGGTDTTARNTVWNLSLWFSFCEAHKIKGTKVAVLGDDIAVGTGERGIPLRDWVNHCFTAGMSLKAFERQFLCDLTFLSRFFYYRGDQYFMVPLIGKALFRFNARANRREDLSDDEYMAGKSLSYAYEFRHVDYLRRAFLDRFLSTGVDSRQLKFLDLTWFARQGLDSPGQVYQLLLGEQLSISDDDFLDLVMAKYDIGLYDMDYLCNRLIKETTVSVFSDERYYSLAHEVE